MDDPIEFFDGLTRPSGIQDGEKWWKRGEAEEAREVLPGIVSTPSNHINSVLHTFFLGGRIFSLNCHNMLLVWVVQVIQLWRCHLRTMPGSARNWKPLTTSWRPGRPSRWSSCLVAMAMLCYVFRRTKESIKDQTVICLSIQERLDRPFESLTNQIDARLAWKFLMPGD